MQAIKAFLDKLISSFVFLLLGLLLLVISLCMATDRGPVAVGSGGFATAAGLCFLSAALLKKQERQQAEKKESSEP